MPYKVEERDGKHCVVNADTNDVKGCHDSKEDAERQVRLLHELEKDE